MKNKENFKDFLFAAMAVFMVAFLLLFQIYSKREEEKIIGVHIKGAVNTPGYYELKSESRVADALKKAGGETGTADLSTINLAQRVYDGEEIVVPDKTDNLKVNDSRPNNVSADNSDFSDNKEKININTAEMHLLCQLDGIGEATAQLILDYRKEIGKFKSIEEIMNVKGIGNAKFNKIKDRITV